MSVNELVNYKILISFKDGRRVLYVALSQNNKI